MGVSAPLSSLYKMRNELIGKSFLEDISGFSMTLTGQMSVTWLPIYSCWQRIVGLLWCAFMNSWPYSLKQCASRLGVVGELGVPATCLCCSSFHSAPTVSSTAVLLPRHFFSRVFSMTSQAIHSFYHLPGSHLVLATTTAAATTRTTNLAHVLVTFLLL